MRLARIKNQSLKPMMDQHQTIILLFFPYVRETFQQFI